MRRWARIALCGMLLAFAGCTSGTDAPTSMRVVVLDAANMPDGGKWNDLLGRPLIEVEYSAARGTGTGGRTLFLYDGRSGECKTIIHAPANPGDPMLVSWAPCK